MMVPLEREAMERVLSWAGGGAGSTSLAHALVNRRPGLWGDHPLRPRSVVLVREADGPGAWDAFGAGAAEPAVAWLAGQGRGRGRAFALLAPADWEAPVRRRAGMVSRGLIETWARDGAPATAPAPPGLARRLGPSGADADAFAGAAPPWALRGWGSYDALIALGAAFGVADRAGRLAAVAWTFEADSARDALAVATLEPFRRLGLGRLAASALVASVEAERHRAPSWTVAAENLASKALARSLGFTPKAEEVVLRWRS